MAALPTIRLAARLAGALIAIAALAALCVRLAGSEQVRAALGFPFSGVPASAWEAWAIFRDNLRLMVALCAGAAVVRCMWALSPSGERARAALGVRVARAVCDTLICLCAAGNAALVGAALGAYGARMALALLPHGPFELAAFCLAGATYVDARGRSLKLAAAARTGAAAVGLLALAAVLETFLGV